MSSCSQSHHTTRFSILYRILGELQDVRYADRTKEYVSAFSIESWVSYLCPMFNNNEPHCFSILYRILGELLEEIK